MRERMSQKIQLLKFYVFLDGEDDSVLIAKCQTFKEVLDLLNDMHEAFWSNDCYDNIIGWTIRVSLEEVSE